MVRTKKTPAARQIKSPALKLAANIEKADNRQAGTDALAALGRNPPPKMTTAGRFRPRLFEFDSDDEGAAPANRRSKNNASQYLNSDKSIHIDNPPTSSSTPAAKKTNAPKFASNVRLVRPDESIPGTPNRNTNARKKTTRNVHEAAPNDTIPGPPVARLMKIRRVNAKKKPINYEINKKPILRIIKNALDQYNSEYNPNPAEQINRCSLNALELIRSLTTLHIRHIIESCLNLTKHAKRKTLMVRDFDTLEVVRECLDNNFHFDNQI